MIRRPIHATLILTVVLTAFPAPASPQTNLDKIMAEYQTVTTELKKHLATDQEAWIDDDPQSPALLKRQWTLIGEWVAAWLDSHPSASASDVKAAIVKSFRWSYYDFEDERYEYASDGNYNCLALGNNAFLVAGLWPIGNVFIVSKSDGHYRLVWSIAQPQQSLGKKDEDDILAAWQAAHAQFLKRGPYSSACGSFGSVWPIKWGKLPNDAKGRVRFYIEGDYAQVAGGTGGAQISLWVWDGITAHPLIARDYDVVADQRVRTRLEGNLLKVQQKKDFCNFSSCGMCEGRQVDWIVRITPEGVNEIGEKVVAPELDVIDELFYRLIYGKSEANLASPDSCCARFSGRRDKSATDLAAPAAVKAAEGIIREVREPKRQVQELVWENKWEARVITHEVPVEGADKQWKENPTLGMIDDRTIAKDRNEEVLCFGTNETGTYRFRLKPVGDRFYISDISEAKKGCKK
jgi:hypothetical protein